MTQRQTITVTQTLSLKQVLNIESSVLLGLRLSFIFIFQVFICLSDGQIVSVSFFPELTIAFAHMNRCSCVLCRLTFIPFDRQPIKKERSINKYNLPLYGLCYPPLHLELHGLNGFYLPLPCTQLFQAMDAISAIQKNV